MRKSIQEAESTATAYWIQSELLQRLYFYLYSSWRRRWQRRTTGDIIICFASIKRSPFNGDSHDATSHPVTPQHNPIESHPISHSFPQHLQTDAINSSSGALTPIMRAIKGREMINWRRLLLWGESRLDTTCFAYSLSLNTTSVLDVSPFFHHKNKADPTESGWKE